MKHRIKSKQKFILLLLALSFFSCKDLLTVDPPEDQVVDAQVYATDETANAAMRGIYSKLMSGTSFASGAANSVGILAGRSADEFENSNTTETAIQFSSNNLLPENTSLRTGLWQDPYKAIYFCNLLIENLQRSPAVSAALKDQLKGEALFIRAFCNFYLTNLFGGVPNILTTDYRINAVAFASSQTQLYDQVEQDLLDAEILLRASYTNSQKTRVSEFAATALLARVYLFKKDWSNAEMASSKVIAINERYALPTNLNAVFSANSAEAILQFSLTPEFAINTNEGNILILTSAPSNSSQVYLRSQFLQQFEPGDLRLKNWVGTYTNASGSWRFPFKYKIKRGGIPFLEHSMVLRLAEQYLIRAESNVMLNKFESARSDLNLLRSRAGLTPLTLDTKPELIVAVAQERKCELFTEWGHRWLDLKRTGQADVVLGQLKLSNWQPTDIFYPIPKSELLNNPNLTQNTGY